MVEVIEALLGEVRELRRIVEAKESALPQVLTMSRSAFELSVSLTTLKQMVRHSEVLTVKIGARRMIPASEIRRLSAIDIKPSTPKLARPSELQDPDALRRRRR